MDTGTDTTRYVSPATLENKPVIGQPIVKIKAADESIVSDTTLQDDDHIHSINLTAGKFYEIFGVFISGSTQSGNWKYKWVFTNAIQADNRMSIVNYTTGDVQFEEYVRDVDAEHTLFMSNDIDFVKFHGFFRANASTGGTLKLQWAQGSSSVTPRIIKKNSFIKLVPLD